MQSDDRQNNEPKDDGLATAEEERMIRIMQYCDGVLPAREAAAVADEIARDPAAARLAAEFAAGARAAQSAWGDMDTSPVPFELARRVTQAARQPVRGAMPIDWRIAAVLVLGVALGMLGLMLTQHDDKGLRLAGSQSQQSMADISDRAWAPALMAALAKDPESARIGFGNGGDVSIARWFDTSAGLHCAEFAHTSAGAVAGVGIACRKPDGGWDVIEQPK